MSALIQRIQPWFDIWLKEHKVVTPRTTPWLKRGASQ